MQSQPSKAWKLGLTTLHTWFRVLSPQYDMDTYMATLFGGETWDLCFKLNARNILQNIVNPMEHCHGSE
jgi:hypothetical protein